MICSLCRKKQNFMLEDFPLSKEHLDCRICVDCNNNINQLKNGRILDELLKAREYVGHKFENLQVGSPEYQYVQSLMCISSDKVLEIEGDLQVKEQQKQSIIEREQRIESLIKNIMLTTSISFDGYFVEEYKGIVSGETVLGTGFLSELGAGFSDLFGVESRMFSDKMGAAKNTALDKLILKTAELEANAVIALTFSFANFTSNMIGIMATGTAVKIKKL